MSELNPILNRINNLKINAEEEKKEFKNVYKPPVKSLINLRNRSPIPVTKKQDLTELSSYTYNSRGVTNSIMSEKKDLNYSKYEDDYKYLSNNKLRNTVLYQNYNTEGNLQVNLLKNGLSHKEMKKNGSESITRSNTHSLEEKHDTIINLEDLMLLEEKLTDIITTLNNHANLENVCFEWWNFYFNCSLCGKLQHYFKEELSKQIVKDYYILELISVILCYHLPYSSSTEHVIKSIMELLHKTFLVICDYFLSKISSDSLSNVWVFRLRNLLNSKLQFKIKKNQHIIEIKENNQFIYDSIQIIIKNSDESEIIDILTTYTNNISCVNINLLNDLFRNKILKVVNKKASVLASVLISAGEKIESHPFPYIKEETTKEYTLVLDLDETLVHFTLNENDNKGILRLRPGIFEFLENIYKYYEIIIFTASTKDYADPILDAIESEKKYFDYRLYRQHTVIVDNDFVKDISKIGRDLNKTIIIDNMPQNFRLQKDNGIYIKTFYGVDRYDTALIDLIPILQNIAFSGTNDVKKELLKYREEILNKISSNISRNK